MERLEKARETINRVDAEIARLFEERMEAAREVAAYKKEHGLPILDAAREAGARGGTVLHGKGTGSTDAAKFFGVSIASEKEVIMIVAKSSEKAGIMKAVINKAGTQTDAGAVVMSLPVSAVAGFGMIDNN